MFVHYAKPLIREVVGFAVPNLSCRQLLIRLLVELSGLFQIGTGVLVTPRFGLI